MLGLYLVLSYISFNKVEMILLIVINMVFSRYIILTENGRIKIFNHLNYYIYNEIEEI